ncbi:DNA-deoxyinosine glycosylase [Uliginosibacterium sediminicola]|uniref:DNA-deoxyinosine glycosylase n=1 Tax=Uliginosibacterium sediminicola TaxID=2024550 RepID=A0ABU9YVJ5_9RHOO
MPRRTRTAEDRAAAGVSTPATRLQSLPPRARSDARLLILGSMPGTASLRAQRYYAHPQNQFWRLLGELLGFDPALPYEARIDAMQQAGIALWDVLHSCERPGSLDADIVRDSLQVNDFAGFFAAHPQIQHVGFNGAAAEQLFMRHVAPQLVLPQPLRYRRLPSSSPANAAISGADKLHSWRQLIDESLKTPR